MRRILIFLCLILVIIPFNAFAAAPNGNVVENLLLTDYIDCKYTGGQYQYQSPSNFTNITFVSFEWDTPPSTVKYDYVLLTLYLPATTMVKDVRFARNGSSASSAATYVGGYGPYKQYKFNILTSLNTLKITINFNSAYSGQLGIVSCLGYAGLQEPVMGARVYRAKYYRNSQNVLTHDQGATTSITSFPQSITNWGEKANWYYDIYHIDIPQERLTFDNYQYINFEIGLFLPYSVSPDSPLLSVDYWNDKVSFSLFYSGKTEIAIEPNISTSIEYGFVGPQGGGTVTSSEFIQVRLSISVDVSSFDVNGYTPDLNIEVPPLFDPSKDEAITWLAIYDINLAPLVESLPWYQTMWYWIQKQWNVSTNTIGTFFTNWSSAFSDWWSTARNFFGNEFNYIKIVISTWGNNIVNALKPDNPVLPEVEDQLATAASDFHDEMDIIESVTAPSADPDDLIDEVFTIVPLDDPSGNAILTGLVEFETFIPMAIVVLTFSIVGLVFFGKRS